MLRAVIFDLDDTLYPEASYVASGFRAAGAALAAQHGVAGFAAMATAVASEGFAGKVFDEALRRLGADTSLAPFCLAAYRAHRPEIELFPEADEALRALRPRFALGVLTDGWLEVQTQKVAVLGLAARVDAVVCTDAFGRAHWKPASTGYEAIAEALRVQHTACAYVADNPAKDFITARALGWRTVQVARPGQTHSAVPPTPAHAAERVAEGLREAVAMLQEWGADG